MSRFVFASFLVLLCPLLTKCQSTSFTYTDYAPDQPVSFRGLSVVDNSIAWASGSKGTVAITRDGGKTWSISKVKGYESTDFRSVYAFDGQHAIIGGIGSPGYLLMTSDGGSSWTVVYKNDHPDVFIDGVDFWNEQEGVAYGDPIDGKMFLIKTSDGGKTWQELTDKSRPALKAGEASFAASGTGIRCLNGKKLAILSGGMQSRLFLSSDQGNQWDSLRLPIIQGKSTRGAFSIAFRDKNNGIITGGDFESDTLRQNHVFYTTDGALTWKTPTKATGGYRECVEFINRNTAIAIGPAGADITADNGRTWQPLSPDKAFHVVRKARKGSLIVMAGNGKLRVAKSKQ
jgi:photosystem II stability/assembly factor-like uncharacterized protein